MKKWVLIAVVIVAAVSVVLGGGFVVPLVYIYLNLSLNDRDSKLLLRELKVAYPDLRISAGGPGEGRHIYVRLFDRLGAEQVAEIREWLSQFKTQHGVEATIWLFPNGQVNFSDPEVSKL